MSNTLYNKPVIDMVYASLHVTYQLDPSSVTRILNEITSGITWIRRYVDPEATCEPGTAYAQMLCEYVLRAEAGDLSSFASDYAADIISGRIASEVDAYVASTEDDA